jgi:phage terminase large subunit-like protein
MAYSVEDFSEFCSSLKLENGQPMVLEGFQRLMLADYFDGVRETVILIPKKNGKTSLLAALALYHLVRTDDPTVPVAAASRKQAMVLFNQAKGFVTRSAELSELVWVLPGYREIRKKDPDAPLDKKRWIGVLDVLAADEDTADGVIPTLGCVDELHRHKTSGLYAVIRDGLCARPGQMVTISTAGDDEASPLGQLRTAAHALPGLVRDGAYRYVRTDDLAFHEWALDHTDDRDDLSVVKMANPASWQTVEELARRRTPSTKPWEWARFAAGVWVAGEESAITDTEWRACADPAAVIPAGQEGVFVGVDIGRRRDSTAVVAVWKPEPDAPARVDVVDVIVPPQDGTATPEDRIWEAFEEAPDRWPDCTFVIDPKLGGDIFAERLEREYPNATVAVFDQMPGPLTMMAQQLSDAIAAGRIVHPDDQELNRHVLAASAKPVGEKWRFAKPRRKQAPIDALIALAMAHSALLGDATPKVEPTVYF